MVLIKLISVGVKEYNALQLQISIQNAVNPLQNSVNTFIKSSIVPVHTGRFVATRLRLAHSFPLALYAILDDPRVLLNLLQRNSLLWIKL